MLMFPLENVPVVHNVSARSSSTGFNTQHWPYYFPCIWYILFPLFCGYWSTDCLSPVSSCPLRGLFFIPRIHINYPSPLQKKSHAELQHHKNQFYWPQDKSRIIHLSAILLHSQFQVCLTPGICQAVCSHCGH